jgi:hypothetical protein
MAAVKRDKRECLVSMYKVETIYRSGRKISKGLEGPNQDAAWMPATRAVRLASVGH